MNIMNVELEELEDFRIAPELLVSTDIVSILRSGRALSVNDTVHVKELYLKAERELLEHLRSLQRLANRIGFLRKQQEVYDSLLLSRIRNLPPEILGLVFTYAVSPSDNHFDTVTTSRSRVVELGLVCTHWRSITLRTPQLWGCLSIELDSAEILDDALTPSIELHLSRSKAAPLHLDLSARRHQDRLSYSPVLQLLVEQISRWGVVRFHAAGSLSRECWESLQASPSMPCLRDLELIGSGVTSSKTSDLTPWFFRNAEKLDTLKLSYCHLGEGDKDLFPWKRLRRLDMHVSSASSASGGGNIALKVLEWCCNLTRATFILPGSPVGNYTSFHPSSLQQMPASPSSSVNPQKPQPFSRPELNALTIQTQARQLSVNDNRCGLEGVSDICRSITCPNLTAITVVSNVTRKVWNDDYECTDEDHADSSGFCDCSIRFAEKSPAKRRRWERRQALWPQRDILDFVNRSKCRLTTLRLKGVWISDRELLGLLREIGESIAELVIHEVVGNNSFAERKIITPRFLERLTLIHVEQARNEALEEAMKEREQNFRPWVLDENFRVRTPTPPPPVEIDLDSIPPPVVLLPHLRRLELKLPNSRSHTDTPDLQRMVQSRWWIEAPLYFDPSEVDRLESIVFILPERDYAFAMHSVWRSMKAEGLAIKIRTDQDVLLGNGGQEEEWDTRAALRKEMDREVRGWW
ncbi:hypothetical protein VNI00_017186 [Paramarasmius palmivorus]|uniref:F-box domain-containing protein n=1 Tax=Paramarasmius palmivorus TaxID=297713 RepID=A0AAW0B9Q3_9AGAR